MDTSWVRLEGVLLTVLVGGLKLLGILLGAWLVLRLGVTVVDRLFSLRPDSPFLRLDEKRARTLAALARSVLRYVVGIATVLTILTVFLREAVAPVLGAAGILGLAVGFGAQNLVRDVISGFFILYEDQFQVGDHVVLGGVEGIVEEIGLRATRIRAFSGDLHYLPNGTIDQVTNKSRGSQRVLEEVAIAYEEDVDRALEVLQAACEELAREEPAWTEGPRPLGVQNLAESGVTLLVWGQTEPGSQWQQARELRRRIKKAFDSAGIEIPYPRRVMVPPAATKIGRVVEVLETPAARGAPPKGDGGDATG